MFKNIGAKIKGYAKILFAIDIIAGIIGAIVIGAARGGFIGFLVFLLSAVILVIVAYLSVIFIYALGDITENLEKIKINTDSNPAPMQRYERVPQTPAEVRNENPYEAKVVPDSAVMKNFVRCSCGYTNNRPTAKFCGICGKELNPSKRAARCSCGYLNENPNAKFCEKCGMKLED